MRLTVSNFKALNGEILCQKHFDVAKKEHGDSEGQYLKLSDLRKKAVNNQKGSNQDVTKYFILQKKDTVGAPPPAMTYGNVRTKDRSF